MWHINMSCGGNVTSCRVHAIGSCMSWITGTCFTLLPPSPTAKLPFTVAKHSCSFRWKIWRSHYWPLGDPTKCSTYVKYILPPVCSRQSWHLIYLESEVSITSAMPTQKQNEPVMNSSTSLSATEVKQHRCTQSSNIESMEDPIKEFHWVTMLLSLLLSINHEGQQMTMVEHSMIPFLERDLPPPLPHLEYTFNFVGARWWDRCGSNGRSWHL